MKRHLLILILLLAGLSNSTQAIVDFLIKGNLCVGEPIYFINKSSPVENVSFYWDFGNGQVSAAWDTCFARYWSEGTFTIKLTARYSTTLSESTEKTITISASPKADFQYDPDTVAIQNQTITITAQGSFNRILWFSSTIDSISNKTYIDVTLPGIYFVKLKSESGCTSDTMTKKLVFKPIQTGGDSFSIVTVNNILTPNDDGVNDYLLIEKLSDYQAPVEIFIYNIWGDMVYNNADYQNNWGGKTNDGKELGSGTYYFSLRCEERKGSIGFIDIIR